MGENNKRASWNKTGYKVVQKIWKDSGEDQEGVLSIEKFGGYKTQVKERIEERQALRNKVKEEKHFEI